MWFSGHFFAPYLLHRKKTRQIVQQVLARKNVQKTKFEAADMIVDPWKQQIDLPDLLGKPCGKSGSIQRNKILCQFSP